MTRLEKDIECTAETVLKEAGFTVSQKCCCRPSCFDFAARKDENLVFVKAQSDIANFSQADSLDLAVISKHFSAMSILISKKAREKALEDDTVYSRYHLLAVTQRTFEDMLLRRTFPLVQAGPGGYYVEIHGEAVKERRQDLGLSVGELAEMTGVSRRTLYSYERGTAKASVSAAYNLICILGIPVARPIDIFKKSRSQARSFLITAKHAICRSKLLQRVLKRLARYNITTVKKAPFDFLLDVPEEKVRIIGGVIGKKERQLDRRANEILSVSRVIQAHPILITEGEKPLNNDILCIHGEELLGTEQPESLIASLK